MEPFDHMCERDWLYDEKKGNKNKLCIVLEYSTFKDFFILNIFIYNIK